MKFSCKWFDMNFSIFNSMHAVDSSGDRALRPPGNDQTVRI